MPNSDDPGEGRNDTSTLDDFYAGVDERANALAARHSERLQCSRGCASCCSDDLTVWEIEADRIRSHHATLLRTAPPHASGACAFLDDAGACRIYADRPYVCRTQGLPLRWFEEEESGVVERRDICPLNLPGPDLQQLADDDCWLLGPAEADLAELERTRSREPRRIPLRSLFAAG